MRRKPPKLNFINGKKKKGLELYVRERANARSGNELDTSMKPEMALGISHKARWHGEVSSS